MKPVRVITLLALGLTVSACATVETATNNAPYENLPNDAVPVGHDFSKAASPEPVTVTSASRTLALTDTPVSVEPGKSPVRIRQITIRVPRSLKVSESNSYYPGGDIVWREDPIGDRHMQVQKIFEDALKTGAEKLDGPVAVDLDIVVKRFHALTERARHSVGGTHSITFDLSVLDPKTGEQVVPTRTVRADLDALGGSQALRAEAKGQTQKVRISGHLAEVLRQEMTRPEGYQNANLGFFQLVNNL